MDAATLSRYPEVFTLDEVHVDEEKLQELLHHTVAGALDHFLQARETEGRLLKADLIQKLDVLGTIAEEIRKRSPEVFEEYKERLRTKIKETLGDTKLDESVVATELVVYSDKICVDEELVRIKPHPAYEGDAGKGRECWKEAGFYCPGAEQGSQYNSFQGK